jgi:hypothetical protein
VPALKRSSIVLFMVDIGTQSYPCVFNATWFRTWILWRFPIFVVDFCFCLLAYRFSRAHRRLLFYCSIRFTLRLTSISHCWHSCSSIIYDIGPSVVQLRPCYDIWTLFHLFHLFLRSIPSSHLDTAMVLTSCTSVFLVIHHIIIVHWA